MRWLVGGALASLVAVGGVLLPHEARACGAINPGAVLVVPVHGQTEGLPRNVQVQLLVRSPGEVGTLQDVRLRPFSAQGSGAEVPTRLELQGEVPAGVPRAVLVPLTPLEGGREFEVESSSFGRLVFSTGEEVDTTPPPAPEGTTARMEVRWKEPDMCNPSEGRYGVVELTAPEAGEPVSYTVREGGAVVATGLVRTQHVPLRALVHCEEGVLSKLPETWVLAPGRHTLELVAVDLAGNASPSVTLSVDADCSGPALDDEGNPRGRFGVGCSGAGGGPVGLGVLLLLGLGLGLPRSALRARSRQG